MAYSLTWLMLLTKQWERIWWMGIQFSSCKPIHRY